MDFYETTGVDNKAEKAKFLGKWLWILFWLFIPSCIASIMANENAKSIFPMIFVMGMLLQLICQIVYSAILMKIAKYDSRYRLAGILLIVSALLSSATSFMFAASENIILIISIIPLGIARLYGTYNEYMAQSCVVKEFDSALSENWKKLWNWYIGVFAAMLAGTFIILIVPLVGLIIMLVSSVSIIAVEIFKLLYLYRTAKIFRNCEQDNSGTEQDRDNGIGF